MNNRYYQELKEVDTSLINRLIFSNLLYGVPGYREGVNVVSLKEVWGKPEMVEFLTVRGLNI